MPGTGSSGLGIVRLARFCLLLCTVFTLRIDTAFCRSSVQYFKEESGAVGNAYRPYQVLGSLDVGTGESSIFLFREKHYILDNIFCGWIDQ